MIANMKAVQQEAKARAEIARIGVGTLNGMEIWETVADGEYTGRYRVAPIGRRDEYEAYGESLSLSDAMTVAREMNR